MVRFLIRWTLFFTALGLFFSQADMEQRFLYFPDASLVGTPADRGLAYEEVRFAAADGTSLHGWYLPGEEGRPLVLFFHGNAGNISHRLHFLERLRGLRAAVFIFDYRGYGRSEGEPGEEGVYADARGALAWLRARGWREGEMVYFGRSLGAGPALELALEAPPAGIVLDAPIPSVAALGRYHYPVLYRLAGWLVEDEYDNLAKIGRLRSPLLVFQGTEDIIVPSRLTRRLVERAPPSTRFHLLSGTGHNDLELQGEAYWGPWRRFLEEVSGPGAGPDPHGREEEASGSGKTGP